MLLRQVVFKPGNQFNRVTQRIIGIIELVGQRFGKSIYKSPGLANFIMSGIVRKILVWQAQVDIGVYSKVIIVKRSNQVSMAGSICALLNITSTPSQT